MLLANTGSGNTLGKSNAGVLDRYIDLLQEREFHGNLSGLKDLCVVGNVLKDKFSETESWVNRGHYSPVCSVPVHCTVGEYSQDHYIQGCRIQFCV